MSAPVDVKALQEIVRREDDLGVSAAEAERALAAGIETRDRVVHEIAALPGYCPVVRDALRRDLADARKKLVLLELWLVRQYAGTMVGSISAKLRQPNRAEEEVRAVVAYELRHLADAIEADNWLGARLAVQVGADVRWAKSELARATS